LFERWIEMTVYAAEAVTNALEQAYAVCIRSSGARLVGRAGIVLEDRMRR
jgi:hypothetical protein